jgi:hypothetical protein
MASTKRLTNLKFILSHFGKKVNAPAEKLSLLLKKEWKIDGSDIDVYLYKVQANIESYTTVYEHNDSFRLDVYFSDPPEYVREMSVHKKKNKILLIGGNIGCFHGNFEEYAVMVVLVILSDGKAAKYICAYDIDTDIKKLCSNISKIVSDDHKLKGVAIMALKNQGKNTLEMKKLHIFILDYATPYKVKKSIN